MESSVINFEMLASLKDEIVKFKTLACEELITRDSKEITIIDFSSREDYIIEFLLNGIRRRYKTLNKDSLESVRSNCGNYLDLIIKIIDNLTKTKSDQ